MEKYLLEVVEGSLISTALLNFKWKGLVPESKISVRKALSILKATILQRGLDRQLYFVNLRATMKARQIIDASRKNGSTTGTQVQA